MSVDTVWMRSDAIFKDIMRKVELSEQMSKISNRCHKVIECVNILNEWGSYEEESGWVKMLNEWESERES